MLEQIIERVHKRRDLWEHFEEEILPPPEWVNETCILGSFSLNALVTRRRWLRKGACIRADGHIESPTTLARDYLAVKYQKGPKITHPQVLRLRARIGSMPMYVKPTTFENGHYVDIEACYWSIMGKMGWNVDYWPGRWLATGTPPDDFPWPRHKIARNTLVSAGMSSTVPVWTTDRGTLSIRSGNRFANLQLFGLIHDVLHSIASAAKKAGAIYINTDGYITPTNKATAAVSQVIRDFGLNPRIKAHGPGYAKGPGDYKVGKSQTQRTGDKAPINKLTPIPYRKWLQDRFGRLAA